MRKFTLILLAWGLLSVAARSGWAEPPSREQLQAAAKAAGSVNGLCPVMGRLVTTTGGSALYKGEKIAFCCPGCASQFEADPTRFMDRMRLNPPKYYYATATPSVNDMRKAKQALACANGRCPVMGRVVIEKGGFSTWQGQRIQFCCPPCKAKFDRDPETFMRLLRADPLAYAYDRPGPTNAEMRVARTNLGSVNGRCPVMGRLVMAKVATVTYRGETIGFCSAPCIEKFQSDPEQFMQRMRAEPAAYGYMPAAGR